MAEDDWSEGDEDNVGTDAEQIDLKELVEEEFVVKPVPVSNVDESWQPDAVQHVVGVGQIRVVTSQTRDLSICYC